MADVFISYRNTPERRVIVRRLSTILRAHEISVWWDYGLEAGESYRAQITAELSNARVVAPLWCAESVLSPWVKMEAELGRDKLVPARLQKVVPPDAFEAIQAADLIGWDGAVGNPRLLEFVRLICRRLGRPALAPTDMIEDLGQLPAVAPLPEIAPLAAQPAAPSVGSAHDYGFWERQWEKQAGAANLVALRAIADEAPRYFADQARERLAEVETEAKQRAAAEARVTAFRNEGRIKIDAKIVHGAPDGWFKPGAGRNEWFKDHEHGPEMVVVPTGSYMMGSPESEPQRYSDETQVKVTIARPFAVGRFAVTFDEWDACVADSGCGGYKPDANGWGRGKQPVINVNWDDAQAYVAWLSHKTGQAYRLLSEAEWEYAARAGTNTPFWWGRSITPSQANYDGSADPYAGGGSKGEYRRRTVPVDSFAANPWGLYNVHGNVWEWGEDWWNDGNTGNPGDGGARLSGDQGRRVVRGGSWFSVPQNLRSALRDGRSTDFRVSLIGFRVGRTLIP